MPRLSYRETEIIWKSTTYQLGYNNLARRRVFSEKENDRGFRQLIKNLYLLMILVIMTEHENQLLWGLCEKASFEQQKFLSSIISEILGS